MVETSEDFAWLRGEVDAHAYPIFFAVLSGAHMYGFASGDSDYDIRGAHVLPIEDVVGLGTKDETVDAMYDHEQKEIDVVTHDLAKFMGFLLDKNASVLEQIFCPHIIAADDDFDELRDIAKDCVTRHHVHHYLGFVRSRWKAAEETGRLKALLYAYRGCFTGIHMMRTGQVESNLAVLADEYDRPDILDLVEAKQAGTEKMELSSARIGEHKKFVADLVDRLEREHETSALPETASSEVKTRLEDLLVRVRMRTHRGAGS